MTARTHFVFGAPLLLIGLVTLVLFIFVLVDMVRRPSWQWQRAGSKKGMWIALEVLLFILFGVLSVVSGIVYLVAARPKLIAAERQGNYETGHGSWGPGPYQAPPSGPGWQRGGVPSGPPGGTATASQVPPSWQPDPTRRHELRYWDGTNWTEYVADGGSQSTDPISS